VILHSIESGQGPAVVLLHGLFGSGRTLGAVQRRLAAEGFRAVSLDLRNHGSSGHDARMDYAAMAGDVAETLASLGAALGAGPAAVLGHSMGGKVAMMLAMMRPELVRRLVVADIAPLAYPPHFWTYTAAMLAVPAGASRAEADASLVGVVPEDAVRGFLMQNRVPGGWRFGLAEIAAALPAIVGWDAGPGGRYGGPVLVVEGGRSDYVGEAGRAAFLAAFADVRFAVLAGAGHWLHAEDPVGFGDAVVGFLRAHADGL